MRQNAFAGPVVECSAASQQNLPAEPAMVKTSLLHSEDSEFDSPRAHSLLCHGYLLFKTFSADFSGNLDEVSETGKSGSNSFFSE